MLRKPALAAAVLLAATGSAHAYSTWVTGNVSTYSDGVSGASPAAGRPVTVLVSGFYMYTDPYDWCSYCVLGDTVAVASTATDGDGNFGVNIDYDAPACDIPEHTGWVYDEYYGWYPVYCGASSGQTYFTATSFGSETTVPAAYFSDAPASVNLNPTQAPHDISPNGAYWARRVGNGAYPLVFVEGIDPNDAIKSPQLVGFLAGSPMAAGNDYQFITSYDYSAYIFNSGPNGMNSIRAGGGGEQDGMAYQAAWLTKHIYDTAHSWRSPGIVMGGYSMGGIVTRAATKHWCAGDWDGLSGGVLDTGCNSLRLWYAGDAPLEGANAPVSLMRYAKDTAIAGMIPTWVTLLMDSGAAREMLKQSVLVSPPVWTPWGWIVPDHCDTDCADLGGCDSYDSDFTNDCYVTSWYHDDFMSWAGGDVLRAGGDRVPAVAFSVGRPPGGGDTCPTHYWFGYWLVNEMVKNDVNNAGDHHLYPDSAGGTGECLPGSRLAMMNNLNGLSGSGTGWWIFGNNWHLSVYYTPTFISSVSSLLWDQRDWYWKDYWYNSTNADHGTVLPQGASGFLWAWASEYLKGAQDAPVCGHTNKTLGARGVCRWGSTDELYAEGGTVCGDGVCEWDKGETCWSDCAPPPPSGTCYGNCGGYGGDCWCDSYCSSYGDCCPDFYSYCDGGGYPY